MLKGTTVDLSELTESVTATSNKESLEKLSSKVSTLLSLISNKKLRTPFEITIDGKTYKNAKAYTPLLNAMDVLVDDLMRLNVQIKTDPTIKAKDKEQATANVKELMSAVAGVEQIAFEDAQKNNRLKGIVLKKFNNIQKKTSSGTVRNLSSTRYWKANEFKDNDEKVLQYITKLHSAADLGHIIAKAEINDFLTKLPNLPNDKFKNVIKSLPKDLIKHLIDKHIHPAKQREILLRSIEAKQFDLKIEDRQHKAKQKKSKIERNVNNLQNQVKRALNMQRKELKGEEKTKISAHFKAGAGEKVLQKHKKIKYEKKEQELIQGPLVKSVHTYRLEQLIKAYLKDPSSVQLKQDDKGQLIAIFKGKVLNLTDTLHHANFEHIQLDKETKKQLINILKEGVTIDSPKQDDLISFPDEQYFNDKDETGACKDLSYDEKLAVNIYSGPEYADMNNLLRGNNVDTKFQYEAYKQKAKPPVMSESEFHSKRLLSLLSTAAVAVCGLSKASDQTPEFTFRGLKDLPPGMAKQRALAVEEGKDVLRELAFISTAAIKPAADFLGNQKLLTQEKCFIVYENLVGKFIKPLSQNPNENEFLVPPSQIQYTGYSYDDKTNTFVFTARVVRTLSGLSEEAQQPGDPVHCLDGLPDAPKSTKKVDISMPQIPKDFSSLPELPALPQIPGQQKADGEKALLTESRTLLQNPQHPHHEHHHNKAHYKKTDEKSIGDKDDKKQHHHKL